MILCRKGHDEVCFEYGTCPMCTLEQEHIEVVDHMELELEEKQERVEDLLDKISDLQDTISFLQDDIEDLKKEMKEREKDA